MKGQPTYANTNINININIGTKQEKKEIEEVAKFFASKVPKVTNFDNKKSRKYFSSENSNRESQAITIKDNLIYLKTESTVQAKNEGHKVNLSVNTLIHKRNPSNILKVSKEILKYAERKSTPKTFYKVPAKFMEEEDVLLESDEEELAETLPNNFKQNKTVEPGTKKKKKEDSVCVMKEKLNNTDIDFINITDKSQINFDSLLSVEHLYKLFIKELELKKMHSNEYDYIIQKYFDIVTGSYDSIYSIEFCVNDKPIRKSLKEFFVQELVVFSLAFNRDLNKNEATSSNLYHAFKTCIFYLHQNMIILMFVCCMLHEKKISNIANNTLKENNNEINLEDNSQVNNFNVYFNDSKRKIEDNKIWLNKNNYKKHLRSNYKMVNGIIKNILKIIKRKGNQCPIPKYNSSTAENSLPSQFTNSSEENKFISSDIKNVTIIINYLKNIDIYKTEVIRDKIYKNLILNHIKTPLTIEESLKYSIIQTSEDNKYPSEITNKYQKIPTQDYQIEEEIQQTQTDPLNQHILLPPSLPFLPSLHPKYEYTLVLDLDETLVHYVEDEESAYIQIRPGAENFLEEMSQFFEIVIFTAAMQDYADLVLDELDKNRKISHRLYRQHTLNMNNYYIKDLSKLGRDITKTIIIDNVAENFQLQIDNGINIKNFEGDENDTELVDITLDLVSIPKSKVDDVRKHIPLIRHGMITRNEIAHNQIQVVEHSERNEKLEYNLPASNVVEVSEDKNN